MKKYENAMKLLEERCGKADKDNFITFTTVALSPNTNGNPRPAVRIVNAYYEDGAFYISTGAKKNKTAEIAKSNEVVIGGFNWFVAHGIAENLGWVKDEKNSEIRAIMKKVFAWWYDEEKDENSLDSIVLKVTLTNGNIIDNEQKYGEWVYEVDFTNKVAK